MSLGKNTPARERIFNVDGEGLRDANEIYLLVSGAASG